jgi:hypothetical protein
MEDPSNQSMVVMLDVWRGSDVLNEQDKQINMSFYLLT